MNETKVLPARFKAKRENGEEVELLIFPHANEVSELKELKSTANKRLRNGQKIFLTPKHLLEVIEDRHEIKSTIVTTQLSTKHWHEFIGNETVADAICDRLVHNAHTIEMKGESVRKLQGIAPEKKEEKA